MSLWVEGGEEETEGNIERAEKANRSGHQRIPVETRGQTQTEMHSFKRGKGALAHQFEGCDKACFFLKCGL